MKIFSWVHRTFHHSVQKEGIGQNVKKTESALNEADKQALLKKVELEDALQGWNGGILTIGTFGFETSKLSNQQKEYLVLESEEEEDEEAEKYFVDGEDTDSTEYSSVEDEELNPLMLTAFGPKIEVIGENGYANEKKTSVVLTVDGVHLSPFLGAYEMSFEDSKTMDPDGINKKGDRITLADLFMADADAKMKMKMKMKMNDKKFDPRSNEKEVVRTKTGLSFAKKLIPRVKEDSHPIKNIQRMMKKMLKKKIHPEFDESNNHIGEIKLVANSRIETFESVSLLPNQDATV